MSSGHCRGSGSFHFLLFALSLRSSVPSRHFPDVSTQRLTLTLAKKKKSHKWIFFKPVSAEILLLPLIRLSNLRLSPAGPGAALLDGTLLSSGRRHKRTCFTLMAHAFLNSVSRTERWSLRMSFLSRSYLESHQSPFVGSSDFRPTEPFVQCVLGECVCLFVCVCVCVCVCLPSNYIITCKINVLS